MKISKKNTHGINSNYLYIYNPNDGKMYVSSNKGISFSALGNPGWTSVPRSTTLIRTVPYSTNHGQTYTTIASLLKCTGNNILRRFNIGISKMPIAGYVDEMLKNQLPATSNTIVCNQFAPV